MHERIKDFPEIVYNFYTTLYIYIIYKPDKNNAALLHKHTHTHTHTHLTTAVLPLVEDPWESYL